jgi:hypothetical protein
MGNVAKDSGSGGGRAGASAAQRAARMKKLEGIEEKRAFLV